MASDQSSNLVKRANVHALKAVASASLAWLAWQLHSPDFWFFAFLAFICGATGALYAARWVFDVLRLGFEMALGAQARFKRKGAKPKADSKASETSLRDAGLIK